MKAICFLFVSLLFFTSCHRQQVTKPAIEQSHAPLVIDYPAGVMVNPTKKQSNPANHNVSFAERVLSPHSIPVLDSKTGQMVFVKLNGDRVTIAMDALAGRYDIILFNAVSDPMPLRIADLQGAMNQIFNFSEDKRILREVRKANKHNYSLISDTAGHNSIRLWVQQLINQEKRIIVTTPDTTSQKFVARMIPGVQWVEQRLDTRSILKINFENDLITYSNTDRYFTNGITFDLQAAWLSRSPLQKLMIPYRHKALVSYNLNMVQDMFTPTDTRIAPALNNDRPYSSYLYFGFRKTVSDPLRKLKIASQFSAGYIGPYSPGSYLQTIVHKTFPTNDAPLGWETQINTDIILNYSLQVQKAIVYNDNLTLLAGLDVQSGTLFNTSGASLQLQVGKADPVFGMTDSKPLPKSEYYFFAKTHLSAMAYNALLQGGMFNPDNIYTLKGNEIQRIVGTAEAGLHFRYKGMGIELAQHYLSPEYKGGLWHKWGRISLLFTL